MFIQLSRHWWSLTLQGIAAILFGIIALAWRGDTRRAGEFDFRSGKGRVSAHFLENASQAQCLEKTALLAETDETVAAPWI